MGAPKLVYDEISASPADKEGAIKLVTDQITSTTVSNFVAPVTPVTEQIMAEFVDPPGNFADSTVTEQILAEFTDPPGTFVNPSLTEQINAEITEPTFATVAGRSSSNAAKMISSGLL